MPDEGAGCASFRRSLPGRVQASGSHQKGGCAKIPHAQRGVCSSRCRQTANRSSWCWRFDLFLCRGASFAVCHGGARSSTGCSLTRGAIYQIRRIKELIAPPPAPRVGCFIIGPEQGAQRSRSGNRGHGGLARTSTIRGCVITAACGGTEQRAVRATNRKAP